MDQLSMSPATESIQYAKARYNYAYKNQPDLMLPKGDPLGYGTVVMLLTPDKASSMKILNEGYASFYRYRYRYYTTDTRISEKFGSKRIKVNNTSQSRKEFTTQRENPSLKFVSSTELSSQVLKMLKNYIYDTGHMHSLFFQYRYIRGPEKMCLSYIDFLYERIKNVDIEGYDNKILYLSLPAWKAKGCKFGISKKYLDNPLSILMLCIYRYPHMLKNLINNKVEILLVDEGLQEFMKIKLDESLITQKANRQFYSRLKTQLKRMSAYDDLQDEEKADSELTDATTIEKAQLVNDLTRRLVGNSQVSSPAPTVMKNPPVTPAKAKPAPQKSANELPSVEKLKPAPLAKSPIVSVVKKEAPVPRSISTPQKQAPTSKPSVAPDKVTSHKKEQVQNIFTEQKYGTVDEDDLNIKDEIDGVISTMVETDPTLTDDSLTSEEVADKVEEKVKQDVFISKFVPERTVKQQRRIDEYTQTHNEVLKQSIPQMQSKIIEHSDFHNAVAGKNNYIKESNFANFDKSYNDKKFRGDINMCVDSLAHADYPVFVESMEIVDSSNALNQKETYTYHLVDENGKHHTIKLDIPKIIDNNYIFLNGNKKFIGKQRILRPVVKISADEVQICGWMNKCRVTRYGSAITSDVVALKKYLAMNDKRFDLHYGNAKNKNSEYRTSLDFDILSKNYTRMRIKHGGKEYHIYFDLKMLESELPTLKIPNTKSITKPGSDIMVIGYISEGGNITAPLTCNIDGKQESTLVNGEEVVDYGIVGTITKLMNTEDQSKLKNISTGTRFAYARIKVMSKSIPVALFCFYCEGFTKVMQKCGIEYKVFNSMKEAKQFISDQGDSGNVWEVLKTSDKVILWKKEPCENALFMNGTKGLPFGDYTYEQLDSKDTYIDMLALFYASVNMSYNLDQFKDFLLDDCTKEILADFNQPTDLVELIFYAVKLLVNNQHTSDIDVSNMRIRSNEIIAQIAYQVVANAYGNYRKTAYKDKPDKITVNQQDVIKALMKSTLVEDASVSNPVKNLVKTHMCTVKAYTDAPGISLTGMNKVDGLTMAKRAYHPSMVGVMGLTTSADADCGVKRDLTVEPKITSTRGYIETTDKSDYDNLNPENLFTFPELLTPPGVRHDSPERSSMMRGQTTQMVMTDDSTPVLIGSHVESIVPYHMSGEFCFVANQDGEIEDVKDGVYVVKYKDGTHDSFETNPVIHKNSDDGAYTEVEFDCKFNKGYKFKKNEVLAAEKRAFTKDKDDLSASMNIGVLAKVAVLSSYDIYEDSEPVTKKLSERLGYWAIDMTPISLDAGTTLKSIVKVGDHINIGDPLVTFDNASGDFDLEALLKAYTKGASDAYGLREELVKSNQTVIKADSSGEVADIRIYTTVPVEQLSPTLQKVVKEYHKGIDAKSKFLDKYKNSGDNDYYKCGRLLTETTNVTDSQYGKVKGSYVGDGVLIEVYIKHKDILKKGDKITNYTALKGVDSHVIPEGMEPYSEFRPDEEVSAFIAPLGILARKTPSLFIPLFGNKVLVETKRKLIEDFFRD